MQPGVLDALINGLPVFVYRRPDGSVYASVHDFRDFQIKPLKIVRVPLDYPDPETHPAVLKAIKTFDRADWQDDHWA